MAVCVSCNYSLATGVYVLDLWKYYSTYWIGTWIIFEIYRKLISLATGVIVMVSVGHVTQLFMAGIKPAIDVGFSKINFHNSSVWSHNASNTSIWYANFGEFVLNFPF